MFHVNDPNRIMFWSISVDYFVKFIYKTKLLIGLPRHYPLSKY